MNLTDEEEAVLSAHRTWNSLYEKYHFDAVKFDHENGRAHMVEWTDNRFGALKRGHVAGYKVGLAVGFEREKKLRPALLLAVEALEQFEKLKAEYVAARPQRMDEKLNCPDHSHRIPGIWDTDNGALAGKPCATCFAWNSFGNVLAAIAKELAGDIT